jgi:LysM repeat protein
MRKTLPPLFILFLFQSSFGQQRQEVIDYIAKYKDIAIAEMVRCKIPASITLAQGIHESNCGKSPLATNANNHFGIKCKSDWEGKKYFHNDDAPNECFRVYEHAVDSYKDHSEFLQNRSRYAALFDIPITDYKAWAVTLKTAGYATNPKYPQILISTIENYNLDQYDNIGLAMMQHKEKPAEKPVLALNEKSEKAVSKPAKSAVKEIIEPEAVKNNKREEYKVNGLLAIKAQGNEDPLKIAFDYNLDYAHVLLFNDLADGERFKDGEYIFLQNKRSKATEEKYVVKAGETMWDISQKFGIKLRELYQKNRMKLTESEQVYGGEVVYLQDKNPTMPHIMAYGDFLKYQDSLAAERATTAKAKSYNDKKESKPAKKQFEPTGQYKVQESDTLYSIARKFNVSVDELKALNKLPDMRIRPGQTLVVSR